MPTKVQKNEEEKSCFTNSIVFSWSDKINEQGRWNRYNIPEHSRNCYWYVTGFYSVSQFKHTKM